jgi:membrane-bound lytic murein transglycosylase A
VLALLPGCYGISVSLRAPERPAYRAVARPQLRGDDLGIEGIRQAAIASKAYYSRLKSLEFYSLQGDTFSSDQMSRSVDHFLDILKDTSPRRMDRRLAEECRTYSPRAGAQYTAYYEPVLSGSLKRDDKYRYPLYERPDDLTLVRLKNFFSNDRRKIHGSVKGGELLPYLTREQIDGEGLLEDRGLELAWVDDPVALYFLHIQGSGRLKLPTGDVLRVNYAASNGLPYTSVGRYMLDEEIIRSGSSNSIRAFLSDNPSRRNTILFHNPRYIFFREVALAADEGPVGSLGVPLVAGRSIATDGRYVPPGALMYIKTEKPVVQSDGSVVGWEDIGRFAFSHDSGAAIKGPGRADIFWGAGERAGTVAGYMNQPGEMYVIVCGVEPIKRMAGATANSAFERVEWKSSRPAGVRVASAH